MLSCGDRRERAVEELPAPSSLAKHICHTDHGTEAISTHTVSYRPAEGNALHGPRKMVIGFGMYVNYNNREVNLRNLAEAQRGNIENVYDKMWKILDMFSQKIEITV